MLQDKLYQQTQEAQPQMPEPAQVKPQSQKQQLADDKLNSLPQIYKMLLGGTSPSKSFLKDMNHELANGTFEQAAVNQDQMQNPAHAKLSQVTPKNISDLIKHDCIA